jgi:hypothetical protein
MGEFRRRKSLIIEQVYSAMEAILYDAMLWTKARGYYVAGREFVIEWVAGYILAA